ncbi:helix-turn-helix domain-containing protein [Bradyrhizobium canariense]|nr:helix-turn-helix transcriptional regulator [Bradyrhizobium canariense]
MEEKGAGLTQQELARRLESRRSNINRQLSGEVEITLRSLADLAWALDREITFELRRPEDAAGQNIAPMTSTIGHKPIRIIAPKTSSD